MVKKIVLSLFVASVLFGDKASDLEVINANAAYKQNITGAGMNIGVIDQATNSNHIFFIGADGKSKIKDQLFAFNNGVALSLKDIDFSANKHGTFVTSVLIGNKNTPAQGVAYDANTYNAQLVAQQKLSNEEMPEIYDYFVKNKVVAINNSWGTQVYPFAYLVLGLFYDKNFDLENTPPRDWIEGMKIANPTITNDTMRLSKDNKAVLVFSTGNDGINSPNSVSALRSFDESLKTWIIVGAIDSNPLYTTTNGSKVTKLSNYSLADFSNGFKGAQSYGILAPGVNITGANALYPNGSNESTFITSGTSFAAPHVTAAATLVAQKFPFLQANQIADVVLSTANDSFNRPFAIIKDTFSLKTIFYIDKEIPKKDGKIDREQVKKDLIANGYSNEEATNATNHQKSIAYFNLPNGSSADEVDSFIYPHIQKLSFADVYGQGILDIAKAMGGLGKLDANRMSASDIVGDQAIYKINTQGYNAVFSNDISQVLWVPEWHLEDAINSQKALSGISKIGLEKQGAGILVLSANSSYEGDTIVSGGELVLSGSLSHSSVIAKSSSIFTLQNGKIAQNASVGSGAIFRGVGEINKDLENSSILKAGFYDDKSADFGALSVGGKYTQSGENSKLQIAFSKDKSVINSTFKAADYEISGGYLEYIPVQNAQNLFSDNEKISLNVDDNLLSKYSRILALSTNLLDFEVDKKSLVAKNKKADDIMSALQSVLSNKAASNASKNALAQLDNLAPSAFNEAIKSIKETPNSANINTIETMQKGLNIKSTLFLLDNFSGMGALNTSSVVFAPTAAFGDEYLGKVDDIYIKTQASAGIAYRHTNHDDYKQNMYMLDIQGKKQISENSLLGGFIGFANAKTTKDYSEVRSNMFSLGLSYNHDFGSFGLLGLASAGMSFNNYDQSIKYISGSDTDAHYKNYFANFQIGAYKSFNINENSSFAPLAMIDYSVIRQDSFEQNGALAKHYDSSTTNVSRAWLGANLNHKLEFQNSWALNTSLFAFYWHKLGNSDINQDLSFIESAGQKFESKSSHEKQGFYGGIALEAKKNNKFFRLSFSDEKTSAYNQYEIMLRAGVNF